MKVGFYTFGGPTIGTGHLLRCLALSQWLENSISPLEIVFELIDMDPKGVSVARDIISSRFGGSIQIHQDCRVPGNLWDVLVVDCL